ncbi:MAG: resolvase [Lachnospiraceae bacterium]|nr:resolvase [Lachnospiraceae bacterium]MBQ4530481.1 resolvase [Lachnospiraceae bacterium]
MNERRQRRKQKKKRKHYAEEIPCIVFLSTKENKSFDLAEQKEERQLRYINQYADSHGLVPMKIIRRGCFAPKVRDELFEKCICMMKQGKARAILVANMEYISSGEADAYHKIGMVREQGFQIFSVDEGELKLNLKRA